LSPKHRNRKALLYSKPFSNNFILIHAQLAFMSMEIPMNTLSDRMRPPAAAAYLGISASTLAKMRLRGDSPVYSKVGPRAVVYQKSDLDQYLLVRRRHSTSENPN
jgi:predicted DNA-binding transcriptional regulator AlpA